MIDELRKEFINISNIYYQKTGYDYWNNHVKYVEKIAIKLAKEVTADIEIVQISALLHDIAKPLEFGPDSEHNVNSANITLDKLSKYNLDQDRLDKIKNCIIKHTGDISSSELSKEEWCVRNADVLSIFNDISIFYYLAYSEYKMSFDKGKEFVREIISNKYNKLDPILKKEYDHLFKTIYDAI